MALMVLSRKVQGMARKREGNPSAKNRRNFIKLETNSDFRMPWTGVLSRNR